MKILFVLTQDLESPSGLGRYAPLGRELARLGHQVRIAALHASYDELADKHPPLGEAQVDYVAPMHVRKTGNVKTYYSTGALVGITLQATWQLSLSALKSDADIIHIGKPHPMNSLAGLAGKWFTGKKLLLDCDDYEAGVGHFKSAWQKRGVVYFEDSMPFRVSHITTNTYFTRDRLVGLGIAPKRISYISNGIDRGRFAPPNPGELDRLRAELGLVGRQVVAFVGSLSRPGHPVDLLFEAFHKVQEQDPSTRLLLVGGGDDYQRLKEQARQMGLTEAVIFCGRIPPEKVSLYYRLAHVSVDPVLDDGAARGRSPLKLFESWACAAPFVSCDVGDRRRLLGDPPAGSLAIPGDASSLASEILRVLHDPELAAALKTRGLQRAVDYYWDVLARQMDAVYRSL
jgi:glycosyltransferase involved in cell wall biosynthesis